MGKRNLNPIAATQQYVLFQRFLESMGVKSPMMTKGQVLQESDPQYEELLEKPLWQFTGKDHAYMMKHVLMESFSNEETDPSSQKRYVQGIQGIATLFGCSRSTAQRIKKSGIIDDAVTQVQRKILVDADLALQLVKDSGYKLSEK